MKEIKTGVYQIRNIINNKRYVGSTAIDFAKRWLEHRTLLNNNEHHSWHLQKAWNKYGEAAFVFEILECVLQGFLSKSEFRAPLLAREQHYKELYKSYDRKYGYDICPTAGNLLGFKHSAETKLLFHENMRGEKNSFYGKRHSIASKIKMKKSKNVGKNNYMFGKKHSEESRKKMSISQTGKKHSKERIEKNRLGHLGKKHSEIAKINMSIAQKGLEKSESQKENISKTLKVYFMTHKNPFLGKKHSDETKRKQSQKRKEYWDNKRKERT